MHVQYLVCCHAEEQGISEISITERLHQCIEYGILRCAQDDNTVRKKIDACSILSPLSCRGTRHLRDFDNKTSASMCSLRSFAAPIATCLLAANRYLNFEK